MARAKLHKSLMTLKEFKKEYGQAFGKRTGEAYDNYIEGLVKEVARASKAPLYTDQGPKPMRSKYVRPIGTNVSDYRVKYI